MKRPETIFVRNNGGDRFVDRYDGEDFAIEPGETLEIEADAAKLIFGVGEKDKTRAIKRLGWAPTMEEMPRALERLNTFSFHMDLDEPACSSAPASDPEPAGEASAEPAGADQPQGETDVKVRAGGRQPRPQRSATEQLSRVHAAAG